MRRHACAHDDRRARYKMPWLSTSAIKYGRGIKYETRGSHSSREYDDQEDDGGEVVGGRRRRGSERKEEGAERALEINREGARRASGKVYREERSVREALRRRRSKIKER
jgi:hypothetical protein